MYISVATALMKACSKLQISELNRFKHRKVTSYVSCRQFNIKMKHTGTVKSIKNLEKKKKVKVSFFIGTLSYTLKNETCIQTSNL